MFKEMAKYLVMSVIAGIILFFFKGWIAQEDWFIKRFGGEKQKEALLNTSNQENKEIKKTLERSKIIIASTTTKSSKPKTKDISYKAD
jgi:hypothetical protein